MIATVDSDALLELVWAAPLAALTVDDRVGPRRLRHGAGGRGAARRAHRRARRCTSASPSSAARCSSPPIVLGLIVMTSKG